MNEPITKTDDTISLRLAHAEDIPALSLLAGQAFHHAFTGLMPEDDLQAYIAVAFSPEQVAKECEEPGNTFVIAFEGQQWAGYAKIGTRPGLERQDIEQYIEMERLYLLKQYQGRQIGSMLLDYCIGYARDHGYEMLWLNVWERNTAAIKFYLRRGFAIVDWSIRMRGNDPQKAIWMKKDL